MVYLQQDAFDDVDASMSLERQLESFRLVRGIIDRELSFDEKEEAREFFTRLTGLYRNLNYSAAGTAEFADYRRQITELLGGEP
jgi:V/A-type H+-transporting ATPase subunit A